MAKGSILDLLLLWWKLMTQSTLKKENLFFLHLQVIVHQWGNNLGQTLKQEKNPDAVTDQRLWKSIVYWLLSHGLFSLHYCRTHEHKSKTIFIHSELMGPIIHKLKNCPIVLHTAQSHGSIVSGELSPSQTTLSCVNLTLKTHQDRA